MNHNIPYSDTFFVACRYCITRVTHNQTRLRITANIKFKKTCWGLVKSKSDTYVITYNVYNNVLQEVLSSDQHADFDIC